MNKKIELSRMMVVSNEFYKITKISKRSVQDINNLELIPIIANCAFSVEIALKILYYANNEKKITGHNIKDIYNQVKEYGLETYLLKRFPQIILDRMINELENAFEEFRYIYEQKKIIHVIPNDIKIFTSYINEYCINYLYDNFEIKIDNK